MRKIRYGDCDLYSMRDDNLLLILFKGTVQDVILMIILSADREKGAITIDYVHNSNLLVLNGTSLDIDTTLLAFN